MAESPFLDRKLPLSALLKKKSTFLLGARSTGKTSLYQHSLKPDQVYHLLDARVFAQLASDHSIIFDERRRDGELVVIDEVQKLPELLDSVQRCIDQRQTRFLLTGSSARKLRRKGANLLGGRASLMELLPLVSAEIPDFDLYRYLNQGGIPRHYLASATESRGYLEDYVALYLKEEIRQEALTRSLDAFSRFLEIMAIHSGDELAIEHFASDCQVKASTFTNYLEILRDTLLAFEVLPFLATKKRKAITRSKFFLFDVGVSNFLAGRSPIRAKSESVGRALEHFIAQELRAYLSYSKTDGPLTYWRSTSQFEVDLILGDRLAIEVKATGQVTERHLSGLKALREEKKIKSYVVVSQDARPRTLDGIEILPVGHFLKALWAGQFD